jgi:hypothetical protein
MHNKFSYFMQDDTNPRTAKGSAWAIRGVFGECNGEDRIIGKGLWPLRSPDLNPRDFYLWGRLKSVVYANNEHDLDVLKQNIHEAIYNIQQRDSQQVFQNLFKQIQLHVWKHRVDILNIFCDGEYNINYYIWLIINKRSKQCVLAVPAVRQHFPCQVAKGFRRKLPSVKSRSNQPALWILYIYNGNYQRS